MHFLDIMDNIIFSVLDKPHHTSRFVPTKKIFTTNQLVEFCKDKSLEDQIELLGGVIINPNYMDREMVPKISNLLIKCLTSWYQQLSNPKNFNKMRQYDDAVRSLGTYRFHRGGANFQKAYNTYKNLKFEKKKHYEKYITLQAAEKFASLGFIHKLKAYKCPIMTKEKEINTVKKIWKKSLSYKPQINFRFELNNPESLFEQLLYLRSQYSDVPCPSTFYKKYHDKHKIEMNVAKCGTLVREDIVKPKAKHEVGQIISDPNGPGIYRLTKKDLENLDSSSDDDEEEEEEKPRISHQSALEAALKNADKFAENASE